MFFQSPFIEILFIHPTLLEYLKQTGDIIENLIFLGDNFLGEGNIVKARQKGEIQPIIPACQPWGMCPSQLTVYSRWTFNQICM